MPTAVAAAPLSIPARIRQRLETAPALTRTLQAGRALMHFGPWRHAARAVVRQRRPPQRAGAAQGTSLLQLNAESIAQTLRRDGMARAGQLPADLLSRLRASAEELPAGEYGQFQDNSDARALVLGEDVLDVVRSYLGAEPELLECTLVVHRAEDPAKQPISPQRHFHFDYAGWHSLNLFVYLTDVADDSGAHQIVVGTHRKRLVRDAVRPRVPDDEILARYGDRLRTITGPAGTMFFEDTEAFHRRLIMKRRRAMLNVLYASHRSWLSDGRLTPKYSDYLRARAAGN